MAYYYKNVMDDDDDTVLADILSMKISKESKCKSRTTKNHQQNDSRLFQNEIKQHQQQQQLQASFYQLHYLHQQQLKTMMKNNKNSNTNNNRRSTVNSLQLSPSSSGSSLHSKSSSLGRKIKRVFGVKYNERESREPVMPDSPNSSVSSRKTKYLTSSFALPPSPASSTISSKVSFNSVVTLHETFSANEYDRKCDNNVTSQKLTPEIALKIKEELNSFKLNDMHVHPQNWIIMLKFAQSIIDTVFGKKRPLEEITEEENVQKKQKTENVLHRVKVSNLPRVDYANMKKFLRAEGYTRFKKAPKWDYCFITLDNEQEALECVKKLNGYTYKKKELKAEYDPTAEVEYRERFNKNKKPQADPNDTRTSAEKLADQVTPLWRMDYEQQLVKKNRQGLKALTALKKKVSVLSNDKTKSQIGWALEPGMLPCEMLPTIGSPEINNYRTKCEFTIGTNLDGEPTVGFLLGLYRDGIIAVLEPDECLNVSDTAKQIAKSMSDYIKASDLPVYDRVEKKGCWRTIMAKTPSTGEVMILVQLSSADLSPERLDQEKANLIEFWEKKSPVSVTTLLLQVWNGSSNGFTDKAPVETLVGSGYVHEELLGLRFRLSASAFFQVNTAATEILYSKCAEWCNIDSSKKTTLLDLCCGTGTIGLTMAKSVDKVIGIEMVPEAIEDAKINAALNGVNNVTYYASKVENAMHHVRNERNQEVIAVLDPPRNGVHSSVINAVRENTQIDRLIYISCDAKQALDNFVSLCRPQSNKYRGVPFKPSRAVSIDLFPHTEHCELLVEFVRVKEDEEEEVEQKEGEKEVEQKEEIRVEEQTIIEKQVELEVKEVEESK
ncbi:hypothetical protein G6F62_006496 [Rhizopus arrhizus]|nr:hypothetical protein G6F62_006496 [Rhizopus arrhizus]